MTVPYRLQPASAPGPPTRKRRISPAPAERYQGTEALIDALVAADKPFTMMAYPNRSHGIFEGRGTTRHLYGLLTRFLVEKLPPEPRAEP